MRSFSFVFCSISDRDESNHKLFNFDFSIIFIGFIICDKRFFIGVRGVRARFRSTFPSPPVAKLLSDLERFDTERR
jgi:hypothetical protein